MISDVFISDRWKEILWYAFLAAGVSAGLGMGCGLAWPRGVPSEHAAPCRCSEGSVALQPEAGVDAHP